MRRAQINKRFSRIVNPSRPGFPAVCNHGLCTKKAQPGEIYCGAHLRQSTKYCKRCYYGHPTSNCRGCRALRSRRNPSRLSSADVEKLAREFSRVLRSWLKPHEMADVIKRNKIARRSGEKWCASHDYCDANMAMEEAVHKVFGRGFTRGDWASEKDQRKVALWNAAWDRAMANDFWVSSRKNPARPSRHCAWGACANTPLHGHRFCRQHLSEGEMSTCRCRQDARFPDEDVCRRCGGYVVSRKNPARRAYAGGPEYAWDYDGVEVRAGDVIEWRSRYSSRPQRGKVYLIGPAGAVAASGSGASPTVVTDAIFVRKVRSGGR